MLLIDTNVLMYKSGAEHPLKEPCTQVMSLIAEGRLKAMTTPEAIQEFAHIYGRRRDRQSAAQRAVEFAEVLAPLRMTEAEHLEVGLALWQEHEELGAFDAVLAAVALDTKHATIVSADRAFGVVPGLTHVYPDAEGIRSLIEA